jgi:3-oxoadipate enol-lactonase
MGYYIDDCTDPWTTPEVIVMLPGCRKPRQVFYAWIPTLARHYQVIRPHWRGHWDSTPAPAGYEWSVAGFVRDLRNFLDALGLDKVHLVGESLGGFIGYHFAHHHQDKLRSLTLATSPGPSFKNNPIARAGSMAARHPVWGVDEKSKAQLIDEFGPEHRDLAEWGYVERWKSPQAATAGFFHAAASCEVDVEPFLAAIKTPTLSMTGAECTRIIPLEEAQRLCDLMPNARLVKFAGIKAQCQFVIAELCAQETLNFIKSL